MAGNTQTPQGAIMRRLLRRKDVEIAVKLSRSTIYSKIDPKSKHFDPAFPKPITLGSNSIAWVEAEISAWIESRITASRAAS